jgi:hypothetical protein
MGKDLSFQILLPFQTSEGHSGEASYTESFGLEAQSIYLASNRNARA